MNIEDFLASSVVTGHLNNQPAVLYDPSESIVVSSVSRPSNTSEDVDLLAGLPRSCGPMKPEKESRLEKLQCRRWVIGYLMHVPATRVTNLTKNRICKPQWVNLRTTEI